MLKLTNSRLRRLNIVSNSFTGRISNATEKFLRTPEVSFSKILSPKSATRKRDHANFVFNSEGLVSRPSHAKNLIELNLMGDGDSSPSLKTWVSSPWM